MTKFKLIGPAVILAAGFAVLTTATYAKPQYMKDVPAGEKKECAFCHVDSKAKPKELTPAGTYYKDHKNTFDGYKK